MKKIYNPAREEWPGILQRPTQTVEDIEATVSEIFSEIRAKGDTAVQKYTRLFDGVSLKNSKLLLKKLRKLQPVFPEELKAAINLQKGISKNSTPLKGLKKWKSPLLPGCNAGRKKGQFKKLGFIFRVALLRCFLQF
jgi:histidinol dehydrogenase